jgi:adenylate cyclase
VHVGLALFAVYERRTLRMPPLQALRIVLGLLMPLR